MEAVAKKTKGKSGKAKVKPNPDEVIDMERPGSEISNTSAKSAQLFSAASRQLPLPTEPSTSDQKDEPDQYSRVSSAASSRLATSRSRQIAPVNSGSHASLRSGRSKEAWQGEELKPDTPDNVIARPASLEVKVTAKQPQSSRETTDLSSVSHLQPASRVKSDEQAYVPYLFARDTIVRIVNDMHRMRENHISVIGQIELNYKLIEDETQRQFNSFVLNLRNVYKDKLAVFQHIVELHRRDTDRKKEYWDSNLGSLSAQNKKLLTDKKALLIQNKLLFERVVAVREEERTTLIGQLDALQLQLNQESAAHKSLEEEKARLEARVTQLEDEISELRSRPAVTESTALAASALITPADEPSQRAEDSTTLLAPILAVAAEDDNSDKRAAAPQKEVVREVVKEVYIDASEEEKAELSKERQRISQELSELAERRAAFESERETLLAEKKQLATARNELATKLGVSDKTIAEWKTKYEVTRDQLSQYASLRKDYDNLLAAFNAMAIAASDMNQAESKLEKNRADQQSLEEDKVQFKKDIDSWRADFKQRTGKEPDESDMPESIKEYEVMLKETEAAIDKLEAESVTIEKLKSGEAPPPPKMSEQGDKAVDISEPVIRTVEVKVADTSVVADLQAAEERIENLQKELISKQSKHDDLQLEMGELRDSISDLETKCKSVEAENSSSKATISELEDRLRELKSQQSTSTAVIVADGKEADHADCDRKVTVLEEQIEELQSQLSELQASGQLSTSVDIQASSEKFDEQQGQLDELEEKLRQERSSHSDTQEELDKMKAKCAELESQIEAQIQAQEEAIANATAAIQAQIDKTDMELKSSRARVSELEAQLLANLPPDTASEMKKLLKKIATLTKENDGQTKSLTELEAKVKQSDGSLQSVQKQLDKEKLNATQLEGKLKAAKTEKDAEIQKIVAQWEKKEKARIADNKEKITQLNKRIKELESRPAAAPAAAAGKAASSQPDAKTQKQLATLNDQLQEKKKEIKELQAKMAQLQEDVKKAKSEGTGDAKEQKKQEKIIKEMAKKLDMETKKAERDGAKVKDLEAELSVVQKERDSKESEIKKLKGEVDQLSVKQGEALELAEKVKTLEDELKFLNKETQRLTEAYQTERVQRKKYYNMVEDMKGKIRVYCRARPMSKSELDRGNFSVLKSPDEYSIAVESNRGMKDFTFDRVFMPENTQEQVFEDTYHLVQSAVDGYNVCIFAYGQTGSGKTFTMIGDREGSFPGIAPRAFRRIYELIEENKDKFDFKVSTYMLELYNDKLLDLYGGKDSTPDDKMDIKKDKAGMVFVKGAVIKEADSETKLQALFDEGSKSRHVASTKMNAESSRSHLILSVIIEATNKMNGQVNKGKLSLVDLAGSERVGKTGASAETLKEANSINKSLAALGDVISALSSDQQFIPYRNNKLTMLMQDSLGGNAKTLMFVNISPADYNSDETVTSLTYASRVKLITNDAQKNQDSKEVARLKAIIAKLQAGEAAGAVDEEEA